MSTVKSSRQCAVYSKGFTAELGRLVSYLETHLPLTRRDLLRSTVLTVATPALVAVTGSRPAAAAHDGGEGPVFRHGLSLFGDLKYPPDFKHFNYVNPNAPKGGLVRLSTIGTFDNFNIVVAGVKGSLAAGVELVYDSLMARALDEVSAEYGLLAEGASYPDDFSHVTYRLRPQARWHDGRPVTPGDVIFSFGNCPGCFEGSGEA